MKTLIACAALLATALLSGCGGGGTGSPGAMSNSSGPGATSGSTQPTPAAQVTFHLRWPTPASPAGVAPRLLPAAATAYVIEILNSNNVVIAHQTVVKPSTQASFSGLPVGTLLARIGAYVSDPGYPVPSGTTPLASASLPLTLQAGSNNAVPTITLSSTVDHIAPSTAAITLNPNQTSPTLVATAQTAPTATPPNATVLLPATQLQWASASPSVATLAPVKNSHGNLLGYTVTGVKSGATTITIADPESGKSGIIAVTVNAPGSANTAEVDVTLTDPPPGTLSAVVTLNGGANPVAQTVAWPITNSSETVKFLNLAPGTYSVTAKAFSQANAGGSTLSGDVPNPAASVTPSASQPASKSIDLGGSADTIVLSPANPAIYDNQGSPNSVQLTPTVQGPGGINAAISADTLTWSAVPPPNNPATGTTVSASGLVSAGSADGTVTVQASDARPGAAVKPGQTTVTVNSDTTSVSGTVS